MFDKIHYVDENNLKRSFVYIRLLTIIIYITYKINNISYNFDLLNKIFKKNRFSY